MSPSRVPAGETRGYIVPIGGAENKENDPRILERFVRVSGGSDADIVVIPTASRAHETGPRYEQLFRDLGAAHVAVMDFDFGTVHYHWWGDYDIGKGMADQVVDELVNDGSYRVIERK